MAVTAAMVKELRELSGAGMVDCKNALTETNGDVKKAVDYLREKGLSTAAKKAGRIAAEGVVHTVISECGSVGVVVEINSETDFVAKNVEFRTFVDNVAAQLLKSKVGTVEQLLEEKADFADGTVKDALTNRIAVIGENLSIRRFTRFEKASNGKLYTYIHGQGKIAVLTELHAESFNEAIDEAGKNICMQIAALLPQYVQREDISGDFIAKETEIVRQLIINEGRAEGKPAEVVEKMVTGKLDKNLKEICLLDQSYVKDSEVTVKGYLEQISKAAGFPVNVARFAVYEKGEGIEKKEENFAEEVSKAMGN